MRPEFHNSASSLLCGPRQAAGPFPAAVFLFIKQDKNKDPSLSDSRGVRRRGIRRRGRGRALPEPHAHL